MKEKWINVGKCIAIFGVLVDHVHGTIYSDNIFQYISWYSVSLFIMIMGITSYWSFDRSETPIMNKVLKRIKGILIPYAMAVVIYLWAIEKTFNWLSYKNYFINFNPELFMTP